MNEQSTVEILDFTCPVCGASKTDGVTVTFEIETVKSQPHIPAWDGGPLVPDYGAPIEFHAVDQWLSTNVCADRFSEWLWNVTIRGTRLTVEPKRVTPAASSE